MTMQEDCAYVIKHRCPECGSGGQPEDFISLEYGRDGEGNPLFRRHKHDTGNSQWYRYDGADRLVNFRRGGLF
jgi:YD repeat-containing protein